MLYLLLGTDEFSKKEYIEGLAKQKNAPVETLPGDFEPGHLSTLLAPSLFAAQKIFVLNNYTSALTEEVVNNFKQSSQHIVLTEEKLDKRKAQSQKLLKDKEIIVKEFLAPMGLELEKWVVTQANALGSGIEPQAARELTVRIVGEETNSFGANESAVNLYQVQNELKKLFAFTNGKTITLDVVNNLVADSSDAGTWEIVNALAEKDARRANILMEKFFKITGGSDEKGKIIQLNALLAEQFRSILMLQNFDGQHLPDSSILENTGWKSGRLFVVRKLARKFDSRKVKDFCSKLAALDEQLKSSSTPPRVLLDLITTQIIV